MVLGTGVVVAHRASELGELVVHLVQDLPECLDKFWESQPGVLTTDLVEGLSDRSVPLRDVMLSPGGCAVAGLLITGHICSRLDSSHQDGFWGFFHWGQLVEGGVFGGGGQVLSSAIRRDCRTGNDVSLESLGVHDQ